MKAPGADQVLRDIGRRVAELRRQRGLTQERFSEVAEISLKYLQSIEAGHENLTVRSMVRIAGLLRAQAGDLFHPPRTRVVKRGRPPRLR